MKGNVLIFGNPDSDLAVERSRIPSLGGYKVYWFSWWLPKTPKLKEANWIEGVIVPPALRRGGRPVAALSLFWTFLHLQPCIAHVHYALSNWPHARWIGQLHPLVVSVMGGDVMADQGFHGERVAPTCYLLDRADVITSKSDFLDRTLLAIGPYGGKIRRITWGMDIDQFKPNIGTDALRQRWGLGTDDQVLFCARVCEPRTNKRLVIEAFARCLPQLSKPAKLLISEYLGDPEYCARMRRLVTELGIEENVRFVGKIRLDEMPVYCNLANAVISVAKSDGMPQTLYQAMACGTYPIISDIPQTRELLDLGCELGLTLTNDVSSLAETMAWVVEHGDQARAMGLRNRERMLPIANKQDQERAMIAIYDRLLPGTWAYRVWL